LLKRILKYSLVEATYKGVNKLILLILPLFLTGSYFGIVSYYISIEVLFSVILIAGFDKLTLKFSSTFGDNKPLKYSLRSQAVTYIIGTLLLLTCLLFGIQQIMAVPIIPELWMVLTCALLSNLIIIQSSFYRSINDVARYFKVRILFIGLKGTFIIAAVAIWPLPQTYIYANLISGFASVILFKGFYTGNFAKTVFRSAQSKFFLRFSLPFIFHTIATQLMAVLDRFLLFHFTDTKSLGSYSLSYAIGSSIVFCFIGVSSYMEPMIYKETSTRREYFLNLYLKYSLGIGVLGLLFLFALIKFNIVARFYHGYSHDTWNNALRILICHMFLPFYFMANYNLTSKGKTMSLASVTITSSIIMAVMTYFFILFWKVEGAVWAVFLTYFILGLLALSHKYNRSARDLGKYAAFTAINLILFLVV
jgi:O-antigen/teichoic acid export membrane protein